MSGASFPSCQNEGCAEAALSFASQCWTHIPQDNYLKELAGHLRSLSSNAAAALNLKKVTGEGIDLSGLNLACSNLSQAHLTHSSFVGTNLNDANLIGAKFNQCDFVGGRLERANFTRASLTGCSFSYADLHGALLVEAHLKDVDLMGAILFDLLPWNTDFSGVKHVQKKNFRDPHGPEHEWKVRLSESNPTVSYECYRTIKHFFYRSGLYEDASWAAYRERLMERKHFFKTKDLRYVPSLLMDLLSGYTERPNRVILSSLVIVFLFAFLYYFFNATVPARGPAQTPASFWNSLYFSFVTFTTVGYGDFVPRPEIYYKMLACTEAFSGPFMAGLYIFTLTRRYAAS